MNCIPSYKTPLLPPPREILNVGKIYKVAQFCTDLSKGALLEVKRAPGKETIISSQAIASLQERLKQPEGFKSYGEIQQWLKAECGVMAAYKTVHKLVRYKLRAKLKVPRPRSNKQHPLAQEVFKKTLEMH